LKIALLLNKTLHKQKKSATKEGKEIKKEKRKDYFFLITYLEKKKSSFLKGLLKKTSKSLKRSQKS